MSSLDSKFEPFFKSQTNDSSIKPCSIPKWYRDKIVAAKKIKISESMKYFSRLINLSYFLSHKIMILQ